MPRLIFFGILLGGVFLGAILLVNHFMSSSPLRLPLNRPLDSSQVHPSDYAPKEVVGFLPYWNLKSVSAIPFDKLTTVIYFGIDVDGEGNFNTNDGGWARLRGQDYDKLTTVMAAYPNVRRGVAIVSLDATNIARIINNTGRQDRLIANTLKLMKDKNFQDVNLDLEYAGDLNDQTILSYTKFVQRFTQKVRREFPTAKVSLDAYADSVAKRRIFDIAEIGKVVDQVIIMGYDFHRINSSIAGPVAPLFGKDQYEYEIYQSVVDYLKVVPKEKLVLAVPFYGYEWPTEDVTLGSFVIKSRRGSEISSYKRSIETAKDNNVSVNFDDVSKSAWFSYFDKDSGTFRQVWFENERSLGLKFDLVNQADLAGIGIWALGYDGGNNALLWKTISEKLR